MIPLAVWGCAQAKHPISMISGVTPSPRGDKLAFLVTRADPARPVQTIDTRLWVLSLKDGSVADTRADALPRVWPVAWPPEGKEITFVSGRWRNFQGLDRIVLQGRSLAKVSGGRCWTPKYAPDGKRLGFVRDDNLKVLDLPGGKARIVARDVNHWHWCWSADGSALFYIRGRRVFQRPLKGGRERLIYAPPNAEKDELAHLTISPDGKKLGFYLSGHFHVIDLSSGKVKKLFRCAHYSLGFDWRAGKICYLDAKDDQRRANARLMVHALETGQSKEIASGPFSYPSWLTDETLVVCRGNMAIWVYDAATGKGREVFPDFKPGASTTRPARSP